MNARPSVSPNVAAVILGIRTPQLVNICVSQCVLDEGALLAPG